jgi:mannose-6-phosphate isomerase-like protein (cupin superfamily)
MSANKTMDKTSARHYLWGDNCDSWILADTTGLSVKQELMPPGAKEQLHFHTRAQQFFFILHGTATFYVEDKTETVTVQQGLLIEAGIKHFIANETEEPVEFLVISQPSTDYDRTNI